MCSTQCTRRLPFFVFTPLSVVALYLLYSRQSVSVCACQYLWLLLCQCLRTCLRIRLCLSLCMRNKLTSKRKTPFKIHTSVVKFCKIGKEENNSLSISTNILVPKELKMMQANHVQCFTVSTEFDFFHCENFGLHTLRLTAHEQARYFRTNTGG